MRSFRSVLNCSCLGLPIFVLSSQRESSPLKEHSKLFYQPQLISLHFSVFQWQFGTHGMLSEKAETQFFRTTI